MENEIIKIENCILNLRSQQVMLDRDLAELYGVETRVLNQAVKRNIERFPEEFMFQLSMEEFENWKSQNVISNADKMGLRRPPYAFTEQGVSMLSAVLKSPTAVQVSINIMNAFVAMRRFLLNNAALFQEIENLKRHQLITDQRIDEIFHKMEVHHIKPTQGIFFQGQIFDAYAFFENIILEAKTEIILIDNYVDLSVLERFAKKKSGVKITIFTNPKTAITALDLEKFNAQYGGLELRHTETVHDRFIILDGETVFHLGASLKDLGKKCFAFSRMDKSWAVELMEKL